MNSTWDMTRLDYLAGHAMAALLLGAKEKVVEYQHVECISFEAAVAQLAVIYARKLQDELDDEQA